MCDFSHHRTGRYMFHNMKKLNSVSQHTECYYFNNKKKKKNNVQFPLYTAVKSMDINKGQPETPTSYRWCGNWSVIRKPLNCSHFHAITEIHYIILNTSEHTLINSIYTFILLCILFCTLLLHAPLLHLASSVSYWLLVLLKASIFLVDAQSFYNIAIKTIIF